MISDQQVDDCRLWRAEAAMMQELRMEVEAVAEIDALRGEVARLRARITELEALVFRDDLCGCANRRGLVEALDTAIARRRRHQLPSALMLIDMDGLKRLNDRFGHMAGDRALVRLAQLLVAGVRTNDVVARIGGDEFALLLDQAGGIDAGDTARRLAKAVAAAEFAIDGQLQPLSVAIGVTMVEPGDSPDQALARADRAMYRAKSSIAAA